MFFISNFRINIKNNTAKIFEIFIASLMLTDICLLIYLASGILTIWLIIESIVIIIYTVTIFLLEFHEIGSKS